MINRRSNRTVRPEHLSDGEFASYVSDYLAETEYAELDAHVDACESCSARVLKFREGEEQFLIDNPPPLPGAPAGLEISSWLEWYGAIMPLAAAIAEASGGSDMSPTSLATADGHIEVTLTCEDDAILLRANAADRGLAGRVVEVTLNGRAIRGGELERFVLRTTSGDQPEATARVTRRQLIEAVASSPGPSNEWLLEVRPRSLQRN